MDGIADILAKTAELADSITSNDLYKRYRAALETLMSDTDMVKRVSAFKKENIKYRSRVLQNIETGFDEEKHISSLYTELILNKSCGDFLDAEGKLLELLTNVMNIITDGVKMEFETFESKY